MNKHTPGTYTADGTTVYENASGMQFHVAYCHDADGESLTDDAEANTRLFAAAPELLEACQAALNWLNRFGEHAPIAFGGESELTAQLHIAIAKATGVLPND